MGYFFAEFSILEWELDAAFQKVLGDQVALSELFFRPREGFSSRVQVILKVAEQLAPESAVARNLKDMKAEIEQVVQFRNALAHGRYGSFGLEREILLTTPDLKKQYRLTDETMDEWLDRLEALADSFNRARWHMAGRTDWR